MKYLKKFDTHSQYESYIEDNPDLPNVSICIDANDVHYTPKLDFVVKTKYYVTDTSSPTKIGAIQTMCSSVTSQLSKWVEKLIIDGVETQIPSPTTSGNAGTFFQFNTTGEHTIYYVLKSTSTNYVYNEETEEYEQQVVELTSASFPLYTALNGCSDLTSIFIPNSVTSLGVSNPFSKVVSIKVSDNNKVYDSRNNCNAIIETSTNTLIVGCANSIIPNTVTTIDDGAFQECSSLTSITIPNSVTSIGTGVFWYCTRLTNVTIGSGVISIGNNTFQGCYFTANDFVNNSALDEVSSNYWGATIVDYNTDGFIVNNNVLIKYVGTSTDITIPNIVTSIAGYCFHYNSKITSVIIGNSVTSIGTTAFALCLKLTNVSVNNGTIANNAFSNCENLTSVTIGSGVTSIASGVFQGCSSLQSITSLATTAPTITNNTFLNVKTGGTLYVPTGSDYSTWMGTGNYYLGKYSWTKVEQ